MILRVRDGTSGIRRIGPWVLALSAAVGLAVLAWWGTAGDGEALGAVGDLVSRGVDAAGVDDRVQLESPSEPGALGDRADALAAGRAPSTGSGGGRPSLSGRVFVQEAVYDTAGFERRGPGLRGVPDKRDPKLVLAEAPRGFVSQTERPLAYVEVIASDSSKRLGGMHEVRARTDERGEYAFGFLPPGDYVVRIDPPRELARFDPQDVLVWKLVSLESGEAEVLDFPLLGSVATLTGRVVDTALKPIAGASVTADTLHALGLVRGRSYEDVRAMETVHETTDEQGRYALTGVLPSTLVEAREYITRGVLPPDAYAVVAEAEGHVPVRVVVVPILPDLARFIAALSTESPSADAPRASYSKAAIVLTDIVLTASASVSGVVVTSGGEALSNAMVHMVPATPEIAIPRSLTPFPVAPDWVQVDERGAFRIADLAPGNYLFEVISSATGLLRAKNPPLAVLEGARTDHVRVFVHTDERGTIVGTVVDETTGEPVESYFRVEYLNRGRSAAVRGKAGSFRLEHVPAGPTSVTVRARGYANAELAIDVTGGAVTELRVSLRRSGIVEGLLEVDGASVSGTVYALREGGPRRDLAGGRFRGSYRIEGLESDRSYSLIAYLDGANRVEGELVAQAFVVPRAGEVVRHEFDLQRPASAILGVVTSPDKGSLWQVFAFEGYSLYLEEPHLSPYLRAMASGVGVSGEFRLPVPPGTYTLLARRLASSENSVPVRREREVSRVVAVGAGTTATADFDLE
ncbi:MAG: carboxypeptidase regulatory-like domain-containing protein [Planctomycetota bacterium]|nr:MAG: carboxypeptidase regulatory-like domain-containing protein [Planctomycetota bacterium]